MFNHLNLPTRSEISFIRTKQQKIHNIFKQKRTFMEQEAAPPSAPSAPLAHNPKFPSSIEACTG